MQILMGPHHTIIRIHDPKISTLNLFSFIKNHFPTYHIHHNHLLLTYTHEHHYKHLFLIKWLYSIHKKTAKKETAALKAALMNRVEKPIKIILKHEIEPRSLIRIRCYPDHRLRLSLDEPHNVVFHRLIEYFKEHLSAISSTEYGVELIIDSDSLKTKIKNLLEMREIEGIRLRFHYNKDQLDPLLAPSQQSNPADERFYEALRLLECDPHENLDVIHKRYKKLLAAYHPDTVYALGEQKVREYTHIFQNLQYSFEVIKRTYAIA
jgi:DnaJ-domain-containing protein 1